MATITICDICSKRDTKVFKLWTGETQLVAVGGVSEKVIKRYDLCRGHIVLLCKYFLIEKTRNPNHTRHQEALDWIKEELRDKIDSRRPCGVES